MLIMARPTLDYSDLATAVNKQDPASLFMQDILPAVWSASVRYGLDPLVMVAQAGHETAWGKFGRAVTAWHRNTAGIKIQNLNLVADREGIFAHAMFPSWHIGAIAQAQHMRAYCQLGVDDWIVDPRYDLVLSFVLGFRSPCVHVADLGGQWAPSSAYGTSIERIAARLVGDV